MKRNLLLAAVAAVALGFSAPAAFAHHTNNCGCAVVDINLASSEVIQKVFDDVDQHAFSSNLAFGNVDYSNLSSDAVNAVNIATVTEDVSNLQPATYEGQFGLSETVQKLYEDVNQSAVSFTGSGGLYHSNSASTAANVANAADVSITIH